MLVSCPSLLTKKIRFQDIFGYSPQTPRYKLMGSAELLQIKYQLICSDKSRLTKNFTTFLATQRRQVRDLTLCDVFSVSILMPWC
jgi:hypothetical protein